LTFPTLYGGNSRSAYPVTGKEAHEVVPSVSDRAVINAIWYVLWTGCQWKALHREWFGVSSSVVHERFQRWREMGIFEKLMKRMVEYYAKERGGVG
jgi:transposase